ncbi:MAG: membrane lipoprotein lipid attachment site-containing protein [Sulfuriflexus sp.]|nr:membrane lipoprotein lipid attachment site-containing protein [Sulfuriflexus sp.]
MKKIFSLIFIITMLSACEQQVADAPEVKAPSAEDIALATKPATKKASTRIALVYRVQEPGVDPYESRIIVTDEFIRLDDNNDGREFVLVNRKDKIVYSVSEANDNILVVKHRPVDLKSPIELYPEIVRKPDENAPQIDGRDLVHYVFKINGEACQDATIAEGLLTEATTAIAEYRQILAGQHAITFQSTPADLQNACDMSMHIFQPDRYLKFGLPIEERDYTGYQRSLIDFDDDYEVNPALFILPAEFEQFSIDELQAPPATEATPNKA